VTLYYVYNIFPGVWMVYEDGKVVYKIEQLRDVESEDEYDMYWSFAGNPIFVVVSDTREFWEKVDEMKPVRARRRRTRRR